VRALRTQGLQVDLLGEDLTSKLLEVRVNVFYFPVFLFNKKKHNITLNCWFC
jgi:hypothetical protein